MRFLRVIFAGVLLSLIPLISGCGSNQALNGALALTATSTDAGTAVFVQATATYTNPTKTDLLRTPITFTLSDGTSSSSETVYTNNSGVITIAFYYPKGVTSVNLLITAKSGDVPAYTSVTIPTGGGSGVPGTGILIVTPPPAKAAVFGALTSVTTTTFNLAKSPFVTLTTTDIIPLAVSAPVTVFVNYTTTLGGGGPLTINGTVVSNHNFTTLTTTASGTADLLGTSTFVLSIPTTGKSNVATITWSAFSSAPTAADPLKTTVLTATRN
jgi:hypothetical protein